MKQKKAAVKKQKKRNSNSSNDDDEVDEIINQYSMEEDEDSHEMSSAERDSRSATKKFSSYFTPEADDNGAKTPKILDDVDELINQHLLEEIDFKEGEGCDGKGNINDIDEIIKQHLLEEEKTDKSPVKRKTVQQKQKGSKYNPNADLSNLSPRDNDGKDSSLKYAGKIKPVANKRPSPSHSSDEEEDDIEEDIMKDPEEAMQSIHSK